MTSRESLKTWSPEIFNGAREYRDSPRALELAQATFNEESLYQEISAFSVGWYRVMGRSARVLDLCSATGLTTLRVAKAIPISSATLVDVNGNALEVAARNLDGICPIELHETDAVSFADSSSYDLILMNSAYHHIDDGRKLTFLTSAREMLGQQGRILVGDHFLPDYRDTQSYQQATIAFYGELIEELERRHESPEGINVIRRSGLYGLEGRYEYKVSWRIFAEHIFRCRLIITDISWVWRPKAFRGTENIGSAAVHLSG